MGPKKRTISDQNQERVFQTTVRLPESLHRAFKAKCAQEGKKLSDIIQVLVKDYLKK